jgi:neurofibromin 1
MVQTLLQGRSLLEDAALQLDEMYGIHFNTENFHFAICASLVKGLTDSVTRTTAAKVLSTFLEVTTSSVQAGMKFPQDSSCLPYLGLLVSRTMTLDEPTQGIWTAEWASTDDEMTSDKVLDMIEKQPIKDKELLLNLAITIVDFRYLDDLVQSRGLSWLNRVAQKRPTVIMHL